MPAGSAAIYAWLSTPRGSLWGVWLIGLHAAVLYVVTGLSVGGAVAAALIMLAVFYGLPPLVGMIGSQLLTPVP